MQQCVLLEPESLSFESHVSHDTNARILKVWKDAAIQWTGVRNQNQAETTCEKSVTFRTVIGITEVGVSEPHMSYYNHARSWTLDQEFKFFSALSHMCIIILYQTLKALSKRQ